MYKGFFKRVMDILLGVGVLILVLPVLLITTCLLLYVNQGKPFFFQVRPGKNGRLFKIIKFKTMNDKKDANGELLPDDQRLTQIGLFIRKTSIDELPQLLNVVIGNMSLMGPRPLLVEYLPLYNAEQKRRHEVKPGITGWAQVNGRNALSWEQKFELDVWYADHVSFALDLKIIGLTFKRASVKKGISSETSATMEKFKGTSCIS